MCVMNSRTKGMAMLCFSTKYGNGKRCLPRLWERSPFRTVPICRLKTTISIVIADKAISWNNHQVKLIMMMCFSKQDRGLFQSVYETLSAVLIEPERWIAS